MLSQKEIKIFNQIVKKIEYPKTDLQEGVFNALCKLVPFSACEIVVVNKKGEILLTWREDKWWKGWHFPGGLLRFGDTFEKRIKITAKRELGAGIKSFKFLFVENYSLSKRGHAIGNIFLCELNGAPKNGKFFKQMPKNLIKEQKIVWRKIKKR